MGIKEKLAEIDEYLNLLRKHTPARKVVQVDQWIVDLRNLVEAYRNVAMGYAANHEFNEMKSIKQVYKYVDVDVEAELAKIEKAQG